MANAPAMSDSPVAPARHQTQVGQWSLSQAVWDLGMRLVRSVQLDYNLQNCASKFAKFTWEGGAPEIF